MKIGVMGTGAVGGYFGSLLALAGSDIHFVARGKHYRAIFEEGLQVVSNQDAYRVLIHVTTEPDEIGPVDLLLFCVKSPDTADAARLIEPMVVEDTAVLTLQNGIDNIEKLIERYGEELVMGGTAFIEASIAFPGTIAHTGKPGRVVFGELSGGRTGRARAVFDLFREAGIDVELSDDVRLVLWEKFLFICGIHGVSTLARAPLGLILSSHETRKFIIGAMLEVEALARKCGIDLPEEVVPKALALAESCNANFKPSMLRDLEWRRPLEIEALNGMVTRLGRKLGISTPLNQAIYACLGLENQRIINPFWDGSMGDSAIR